MSHTIGDRQGVLDAQDVADFIESRMAEIDLDGRSLLSRHPRRHEDLPPAVAPLRGGRGRRSRVRSCTAVVALGTHEPMTDDAIRRMVGPSDFAVLNHAWWDETTFADVGTLDADTVSEFSNGMLSEIVDVRINRLVLESDVTIIIGPVLPHEVVGFSGGNKYLFPGLSGQELIDVTHWLGALITSRTIIGTRGITPVRRADRRRGRSGPRRASCLVRSGRPCHGRAQLTFVRRARTGSGRRRGYRGGDPHRISACTRRPRAVGRAATVRRPLDGGQGFLQGRTCRGRRGRGRALRAAHH